jgi:hypothetical protein
MFNASVKTILLLSSALCIGTIGCDKYKTKLIYFGFDDRSETPNDVLQLAQTWRSNPPCPHWRATVSKKDADYGVLFGVANVTITDRRGEVLYSGGQGVLYLPHGNPDGSGVNVCKLTGE